MAAAVNCLLIEPMLYRICGRAGVGGSSVASPYACRYVIRPSCTSAREALGTPVELRICCAMESILARRSGEIVPEFCAEAPTVADRVIKARKSKTRWWDLCIL